jgi:hypothetical protein
MQDAFGKARNIADSLYRNYYSPITPGINNRYLVVGSFGKNSVIRPIGDIDILFQLPDKDYERFNNREGNGPSALLQEVKNVLEKSYPLTEMRGDGQVVCIRFDTLTVEVVPVFYLNGEIIIPNTHHDGSWNKSNPVAETNRIDVPDKDSFGKVRHLLKMAKAWKRNCDVPIKSIVLEEASVVFCSAWKYRKESMFWYDWMIRDFFEFLYSGCQNRYFLLPGALDKIVTGNEWASKCDSAYCRALKACDFEQHNPQISTMASDEWKKIFGDSFLHL